jgi:hypothetical protein
MASPAPPPSPDEAARGCNAIQSLADRYRQNVEIARAILKLYGVSTLFFLQPDPVYSYSEALYRLTLSSKFHVNRRAKTVFYGMVRDVEGVVDLTNLFELWGPHRKAIIDDVHYSPQFNLFLAQHVANHINLVSLAEPSHR